MLSRDFMFIAGVVMIAIGIFAAFAVSLELLLGRPENWRRFLAACLLSGAGLVACLYMLLTTPWMMS